MTESEMFCVKLTVLSLCVLSALFSLAEMPTTRYGAQIYRKHRVDTPPPTLKLPDNWRLIEGDEGVTGCDRRLYYFTVETDGTAVPPPTVAVSWPGVEISSVGGAREVKMTEDGVVLTPTAKTGGACYITAVRDGAILLGAHHHVEGAQHGSYAGRPLPWTQIRASDNWRAACRAMFKAAGIATFDDTDGADIRLFGFDSNYPNHHVDYPEHFHVMLAWDGWARNNVGHYILDGTGLITKNEFHSIGEIKGGLPKGVYIHKLGETTNYVGPKGRTCFSLETLRDGKGVILHKPGTNVVWRIYSEHPDQSVMMEMRNGQDGGWVLQGRYSVTDDTEKGEYVIKCEEKGTIRKTVVSYNRDTGGLLSVKNSGEVQADRFSLDTSALSVEVRRDTLALTVKDRRTGRVWETFMPKSRPPRYSVRTCEADNNQIRLEVTDVKTQDELSIVYRLDNKSPSEFTVTVSGKGALSESVIYPCPLAGRKGDMMILPLSEGFRLPMYEKTMVIWGPRMWESAMSMAFFGVEEDATGAGWMGIAETRNDARVEIFNADGKPVAIGPAWEPERGQYGYPRTMRYVFFDKGGYVAMAKRYRKTAEEQGLVKTFREKAKSRPSIDRLVGAANIWYFPTKGEPSPANMARELKAAGIDRFLWSQYASATNVAQITAMPGVLAGRYDCYRDIYPPDQDAKRRLGEMEADICRNSDAGRNAAIWNSADSNDLRKAWGYTGKDGKKHYCIAQCTLCQPANVRRHVAWELERIPFTSRFIDVATAIGAEECENPAHPMTRTQSRAAICEELRILGDEFGLVVGSEQGIDFAVPYCDYFEGMLCPSRCRMPHGRPGAHRPDIFREGLNPTNVTPEEISRVVTYNLGEKYRIPLFELVFHDCCCAHWFWYDYSNRPICFWAKRDLFNVLYGTAPMYVFDYRHWSEYKEMFVKSYRRVCPVARRAGYSRMTDHRVLTPDRSVQRSEFADGTVVTVNFGATPYLLEDGTELAPMDSHVTSK